MAEINYTLTKRKDVFTITNNEDVPISATFGEYEPCMSETASTIEVVSIAPASGYTPNIIEDGTYTVALAHDPPTFDSSQIYFKSYLNLQLSMIEDIFSVLCSCDCGCPACEDLTSKQYQALLVTRTKIDAYKRLVYPEYTASFVALLPQVSCLVNPVLYCDIAQEGITGQLQYNEKLTKELIALDYLAMYFTDLGVAEQISEEEVEYVKDKYKADEILCCITSLGIDINQIKNIIDNMGTITMVSGAYTNLPPDVVGDNTLNTGNRTDFVYTMAMFTSGTTPAYNDPEGDAADAVRVDTLPPDGVLKLNGTPVVQGQVILATDIDNSLLVFTPPDQDSADTDDWTFSVRDVGSGQFSS